MALGIARGRGGRNHGADARIQHHLHRGDVVLFHSQVDRQQFRATIGRVSTCPKKNFLPTLS